MIVPFGEWLPDLPKFNNPGATEAKNVVPGAGNYLPFQSSVIYSLNALNDRCQGAISTKDRTGVVYNFAGDRTKLYLLQSSSFTDVSRSVSSGAAYSTDENSFWSFARFGEQLFASNFDNTMQYINLVTAAEFQDVVGSQVPKAKTIATIGDFLVAGNTNDADGETPYRVRWSAIGDPASWTVSSVTQSDFQNLDGGGGDIMQIIGGEYGTIFMEKAIYRMDYVGSPAIFQFRQVEFARGTPAPKSVVKVGNLIAYLGQDGFYMFDGNQSTPIGANKVDKYFFKDVDVLHIGRVIAAVDPTRQLIFWVYPNQSNSNGTPNAGLVYNYSQNSTLRWSRIELINITDNGTDYLYTFLSEGYRMIDLDAPYGQMEEIVHRMNSRVFMGGDIVLASFNTNKFLLTYDGAPVEGTIETLEAQPNESGSSEVHLVRPLIDSSSSIIKIQSGTRDKLAEDVVWSDEVDVNDTGEAPVRTHARYQRFRASISGGFTGAIGVDILQTRKAGRR
jgi:hypothetical protein